MIGTLDVECQAKNPNLPLAPMTAFVSSPSSIRVRNVPKRIGKWNIDSVYLTVAYPDGSVRSTTCVQTGGVWTGTIEGTSTSGTSKNGYTIFADGTDENGNLVTGYILGKGDINILEADGTLNPDAPCYYVHLLSAQADVPKEGDMYPTDEGYVIWQNGQANQLGGGSVDKIEDEKGNVINADRTVVKVDGQIAWVCVAVWGETFVARGTYEHATCFPTEPEEGQMGIEVVVSEGSMTEQGYNDFAIVAYYWRGGDWVSDSGGTNGLIPIDGTHYEEAGGPGWTADWEWHEDSRTNATLATQEYVDDKIGSINTVLDAINGEVI